MKAIDWERVVPQEDKYCEWCSHLHEFCTCPKDIEEEWLRMEQERKDEI